MRDLFIAECRRFLRATLIVCGAHLALQLFLARVTDVLSFSTESQYVVAALYGLAGLALAVHQIGSYTQPSRWLWLMHRPLAPATIFAALALAAGAALLVAIGLPLLVTVSASDLLSARTVDQRHYLGVAFLVAIAAIGWLIGATGMLSRKYMAVMLLFVPYLLLMHQTQAWRLLLAALACGALLAYIAYGYFRPNRDAAPAGLAAHIARAVPLLTGFYYLLLWACLALIQTAQIMLGVHPLTMPVPAAGGYVEASRLDARALLLEGLAGSPDPRAPLWQRQLALLSPLTLKPHIERFPVREQLSNRRMPSFVDPANHVQWSFDHAAMRFHGLDQQNGSARGWSGLHGMGDTTPFPAIPVMGERGYLMLPQQALEVVRGHGERATLRPTLRVSVAPGEQLACGPQRDGERDYVLSDQRLIALQHDAQHPDAPYRPMFSLSYPGAFRDLERVDVATLLDGTLVSVTGGSAMWTGQMHSQQVLQFVDAQGHATLVAQRALVHDFPALFEHAAWWISPALDQLTELPALLLKAHQGQGGAALATLPSERPASVQAAALLGSLLAVLGAWWRLPAGARLHRQSLGPMAVCAVLGLPALLCLLAMQARPLTRAPATAPRSQPLPA